MSPFLPEQTSCSRAQNLESWSTSPKTIQLTSHRSSPSSSLGSSNMSHLADTRHWQGCWKSHLAIRIASPKAIVILRQWVWQRRLLPYLHRPRLLCPMILGTLFSWQFSQEVAEVTTHSLIFSMTFPNLVFHRLYLTWKILVSIFRNRACQRLLVVSKSTSDCWIWSG